MCRYALLMRKIIMLAFLVLLASCTNGDVEAATTTSSVVEPSDDATTSTAEEPVTSSTAVDPADTTTTAGPTTTLPPLTGLAYEKVADGFAFPVFVDAPAGDPRLFVVTKDGLIHIIKDGATLVQPFLDVREMTNNNGEQGLLGLAFHPDYGTNGLFYVHYSDRHGDTKIFEYRIGNNPDLADPETAPVDLRHHPTRR